LILEFGTAGTAFVGAVILHDCAGDLGLRRASPDRDPATLRTSLGNRERKAFAGDCWSSALSGSSSR
jgi:hypothetical protein